MLNHSFTMKSGPKFTKDPKKTNLWSKNSVYDRIKASFTSKAFLVNFIKIVTFEPLSIFDVYTYVPNEAKPLYAWAGLSGDPGFKTPGLQTLGVWFALRVHGSKLPPQHASAAETLKTTLHFNQPECPSKCYSKIWIEFLCFGLSNFSQVLNHCFDVVVTLHTWEGLVGEGVVGQVIFQSLKFNFT